MTTEKTVSITLNAAAAKPVNVTIYEYRFVPDHECEGLIWEQIRKARKLYNGIVEIMRATIDQARALTLERASVDAQALSARIEALSQAFTDARAAKDDAAMKAAAQERRDCRRVLYPMLKTTRKEIKDELTPIYRTIGKNSACSTYQKRCEAVDDGLGWGTANAVLDAALDSWKRCMAQGSKPSFSIGEERDQDTLTLQFTLAGGLPSARLFGGHHQELKITDNASRGKAIAFRLGKATDSVYATGVINWNGYREPPEGATIGLARLVARRHAYETRYAFQLMVKHPTPIAREIETPRQPLATIHFGWSTDATGRRVAAIADGADPGFTRLIRLDPSIEKDLTKSAEVTSCRSQQRDLIVAWLKSHRDEITGLPQELTDELAAILRLPAQYITQKRLYRLSFALADAGIDLPKLIEWRKEDRKRWQHAYGLARRARNRRRETWIQLARECVQRYKVIAMEPLDLAEAAVVVDEQTGERTEFNAAARRGRVIAGLHELRRALEWQCNKAGTPLLDISAPTVSTCAHCGDGTPVSHAEDPQILQCTSCGSVTDRKRHGATRAYQLVAPHREAMATLFHQQRESVWTEGQAKAADRKAKMAEGRRQSLIAAKAAERANLE